MRSNYLKTSRDLWDRSKAWGARKKKVIKAKLAKAKRVVKKLAVFAKATKPKPIKKRFAILKRHQKTCGTDRK